MDENNSTTNLPAEDKKKNIKKQNLAGTIIVSLIGLVCAFLFGPLETMLGCLVWLAIKNLCGKNHPNALWPDVVGIAAGVLVSFASAVLYTIVMAGIGQ